MAQVPHRLPGFLESRLYLRPGVIQKLTSLGDIRPLAARRRLQQSRYCDASLDDGIVHLASQSSALGQENRETSFGLPGIADQSGPDSANERGPAQCVEPAGLMKRRLQVNRNGRLGSRAGRAGIGRDHSKAVMSGRKVRIIRGPGLRCGRPRLVEALELISEIDSLRSQ